MTQGAPARSIQGSDDTESDPALTRTPEQILTAHVLAVTNGDLPQILQDYSDDAVFLTPQGALNGREGVESFYVQALASLPGLELQATSVTSGGSALLVNWTGTSPAGSIADGVDTFVFADDSIKLQTSSFTVQPSSPA